MSPVRRMLLALELGDDAAAMYAAAHHIDEREARRVLEKQRHGGRLSRCAQTD